MPKRYETRHRGVAILCGGAPCLFEDLENAKQLRPDAVVLGVNGTPAMIPEIEHIWTQHNNEAGQFKKAAKRAIYVHARSGIMGNDVDYEWPELTWVAGSSGVAGALWAKHGMGFDEVIMAGIPLSINSRVYVNGYPTAPTKNDNQYADDYQVEHWIAILRNHVKDGKTAGIYSMSGTTAHILGRPQ